MTGRSPTSHAAIRHLCAVVILICAGCDNHGHGFYPLEEGRWWDFETRTTVLDEVSAQRLMVANIGAGDHAGTPVLIQRQSAGREVYFRDTKRGLERIAVRQPIGEKETAPPATLVLPRDRAIGTTWTATTRLRLIESRTFARQDKLRPRLLPLDLNLSIAALDDTVTVPAGQFTGCIRVDGSGSRSVRTDRGNASAEVTVVHREWYAPGVGLVRVERSESAESPFLKAGQYVQELLAFD